eukprot:TRINITY_DN9355_c0_g1_i1.p1 TRINITY_DN9355_c0_g1~~TRINITY_DN9355_c0_g1_i1.p1  ORF type:complete len:314 (+),score=36.73 TRINITY_DN9355_c0_g1_i1:73-942(+)
MVSLNHSKAEIDGKQLDGFPDLSNLHEALVNSSPPPLSDSQSPLFDPQPFVAPQGSEESSPESHDSPQGPLLKPASFQPPHSFRANLPLNGPPAPDGSHPGGNQEVYSSGVSTIVLPSAGAVDIFVGGLPLQGTNALFTQFLEPLFEEFPKQVLKVAVMMDSETGNCRGFGFVTIASVREAALAIKFLNGVSFLGKTLRANFALRQKGTSTEPPRPLPVASISPSGAYSPVPHHQHQGPPNHHGPPPHHHHNHPPPHNQMYHPQQHLPPAFYRQQSPRMTASTFQQLPY